MRAFHLENHARPLSLNPETAAQGRIALLINDFLLNVLERDKNNCGRDFFIFPMKRGVGNWRFSRIETILLIISGFDITLMVLDVRHDVC